MSDYDKLKARRDKLKLEREVKVLERKVKFDLFLKLIRDIFQIIFSRR